MHLVEVLVERLRRQTSGPIAVNAAEDPVWVELGYPIANDRLPRGLGPLIGIHAALVWASELGYESVITAPVDTPILPDDYVAGLSHSAFPAIAKYSGKPHFIHGAWPVALASDLARQVSEGMRAVHAWTDRIEARECVFPEQAGLNPFFNVNTPSDLQELETAQTVSPR